MAPRRRARAELRVGRRGREAGGTAGCAGRRTASAKGKSLAVFVRDGHAPDDRRKTTPGQWRFEDWPIRRTTWQRLFPDRAARPRRRRRRRRASRSSPMRPATGSRRACGGASRRGTCGPTTPAASSSTRPSSSRADRDRRLSREFTSARRVDAPVAHLDRAPRGRAARRHGCAGGGRAPERVPPSRSRCSPSRWSPGRPSTSPSTCTSRPGRSGPGHRIRLAVTNAQFPMIWPTPYAMTTTLHLGEAILDRAARRFPSRSDRRPPSRRRSRARRAPTRRRWSARSGRRALGSCVATCSGERRATSGRAVCGWEIGERRYRELGAQPLRDQRRTPRRGALPRRRVPPHRAAGPGVELQTVLEVRSDELLRHVHAAPPRERDPRPRKAVGRDDPAAVPVADRHSEDRHVATPSFRGPLAPSRGVILRTVVAHRSEESGDSPPAPAIILLVMVDGGTHGPSPDSRPRSPSSSIA